jgi:hypothetical protein
MFWPKVVVLSLTTVILLEAAVQQDPESGLRLVPEVAVPLVLMVLMAAAVVLPLELGPTAIPQRVRPERLLLQGVAVAATAELLLTLQELSGQRPVVPAAEQGGKLQVAILQAVTVLTERSQSLI